MHFIVIQLNQVVNRRSQYFCTTIIQAEHLRNVPKFYKTTETTFNTHIRLYVFMLFLSSTAPFFVNGINLHSLMYKLSIKGCVYLNEPFSLVTNIGTYSVLGQVHFSAMT